MKINFLSFAKLGAWQAMALKRAKAIPPIIPNDSSTVSCTETPVDWHSKGSSLSGIL